jgi:hypothetical protein
MTRKGFEGTKIVGQLRLPLAAAIAAVIAFTTVTAWACPGGYVACGERNQLCCPRK